MNFNLEFNIHHIWIGVSWKRGWETVQEHGIPWFHRRWHVWICLIPCVMLHFHWSTERKIPIGKYRPGTTREA